MTIQLILIIIILLILLYRKDIRLDTDSWYYIYTDGKRVFMSKTEPVRINGVWINSKNKMIINGPPLRTNNPKEHACVWSK